MALTVERLSVRITVFTLSRTSFIALRIAVASAWKIEVILSILPFILRSRSREKNPKPVSLSVLDPSV